MFACESASNCFAGLFDIIKIKCVFFFFLHGEFTVFLRYIEINRYIMYICVSCFFLCINTTIVVRKLLARRVSGQ